MTCAIYARVSTDDQNCEMQLRDLRAYAKNHGWKVAGEYIDSGISGTKASRPELDRLMAAARRHEFDVVLVWKLDRWGRSVANCLASLQELQRHDVRWIAITQNLDTDVSNPMARFMLNVMAAFAEFEREMIRERVLAGVKGYKQAHASGIVGKRRHSKSGKDLAIGRPRAVFDRKKAADMRAHGVSLRVIAAKMRVGLGTIARELKAA